MPMAMNWIEYEKEMGVYPSIDNVEQLNKLSLEEQLEIMF